MLSDRHACGCLRMGRGEESPRVSNFTDYCVQLPSKEIELTNVLLGLQKRSEVLSPVV